ncbi:MAG: hypothetical protein CVV02_02145 [Firmicutes bacterium HGW-Firmicutes-7]|nr:MAG: hypothetical protein CVV02_02145 [Firmicutes bacterium HGW-Firmicutes-7]
MAKNIEAVGNALKILIEKGSLSRDEFPIIHENIISDGDVLGDLEKICQTLGLFLNERSGIFYVSPVPGMRTFGYTNEELRKEIYYHFKNEDLYTALFIIANVITEFFPEASPSPIKSFLKSNDLMDVIDKKIEILAEQVNLEEISYEQSYNFEVVVKKWMDLQRVKLDKGEGDSKKEYGKTSKIQLLNTTLRFLESQELIQLVEMNGDKAIYITERFNATILNAYNDDEIQNEIYDYLDNMITE